MNTDISFFTQLIEKLNVNLTQENITFILACIGSLGTFITGLRALYRGRKKISVEIIDYTRHRNIVQFFLYLQNQSSNPICISAIYLLCGDASIRCELLQKKITMRGEIMYRTPLFPLNFPSHVGSIYFLEFLNCPDIELDPGKTVSLEFHTNRGRIKKSLTLQNASHYLHIE